MKYEGRLRDEEDAIESSIQVKAEPQSEERMKEKREWERMTEKSAECMMRTIIKPDKYKDIIPKAL